MLDGLWQEKRNKLRVHEDKHEKKKKTQVFALKNVLVVTACTCARQLQLKNINPDRKESFFLLQSS